MSGNGFPNHVLSHIFLILENQESFDTEVISERTIFDCWILFESIYKKSEEKDFRTNQDMYSFFKGKDRSLVLLFKLCFQRYVNPKKSN